MTLVRAVVLGTAALVGMSLWLSCHSPERKGLLAGRRAMGRGEYREAIRHYNEVMRRYPSSPEAPRALYEVGVIYFLELRDVEAAKRIFREVKDDYPQSPSATDAHRMLARIYGDEQGELRRAIGAYEQLLNEYEGRDRKEIQLAIADYYYELNDLATAVDGYGRVIDEYVYDDLSDRAYIRLAHISAFRGREQESLDALEALLARSDNPVNRRPALLAAAEVHLASDRYEDGEACLERADREFPDDPEILDRRARLTRREQDSKSLDDGGIDSRALLEELQRNISWGRGKRPKTR
jgi:tetratricopeptide (TPR) repeat protein